MKPNIRLCCWMWWLYSVPFRQSAYMLFIIIKVYFSILLGQRAQKKFNVGTSFEIRTYLYLIFFSPIYLCAILYEPRWNCCWMEHVEYKMSALCFKNRRCWYKKKKPSTYHFHHLQVTTKIRRGRNAKQSIIFEKFSRKFDCEKSSWPRNANFSSPRTHNSIAPIVATRCRSSFFLIVFKKLEPYTMYTVALNVCDYQ